MTKIALLADIHGNYHALEAVLADIERQRADRILVLGDLVFKGPLPERCVQAVRALKTVVLQGNIDELVGRNAIQPGFAKTPEQEQALLREMVWTRSRLTQEELDYLAGLPFSHEEALTPQLKLRCVHANPRNLLDIVLPVADASELQVMWEGCDAQIVAYAHIHQPYIRFLNGRALVNTGSVGLPFDGDTRASYALLETDQDDYTLADQDGYTLAIRRVRYDLAGAVRAYEGSGHPFAESVIAALREGRRPL